MVCAYRTASTSALLVIARIPPIHLLVEERCAIHEGANKKAVREIILGKWQQKWQEEAHKGQWTKRLIPNLKEWIERKHGETNYYLTQMISGHGCFQYYRHRFKVADSEECIYCNELDTAEHSFFECIKWEE